MHVDVDTFSLTVRFGFSLLVSHFYKKHVLPPHLHATFDRQWMAGSFAPNSPYYKLKHYGGAKIEEFVREADDYVGQPLQTRFRWLDQKYNELENHIKSLV